MKDPGSVQGYVNLTSSKMPWEPIKYIWSLLNREDKDLCGNQEGILSELTFTIGIHSLAFDQEEEHLFKPNYGN